MRVFYGPGPGPFIEQGEVCVHLSDDDVHILLLGLSHVPHHHPQQQASVQLMKRLKETL